MKEQSAFSIKSPGFLGMNTYDSPINLDPGFALDATNIVIDKYGRISARNGWSRAHTANTDLGTSNVSCLGELVQNDGTTTLLATGGAFLFKHSGTTLTTLTYGGGGTAPTISVSNWQFVMLNGVGIFFQRAYDPLIYDPGVSTTTFRRLSEKTGYAGTVPLANCALSAFGRIWCADTATDKNTVTWSDSITPQVWTGGSSGTLNLLGIWPSGGDEVVALAAHNNFLVIFGKKQILIYTGATTPSSMTLYDSITGIGCIARDSVQNTGMDIVFLSDSGIRSLGRVIQEKSSPIGNVSRNVHSDIQTAISLETFANIKSAYYPIGGLYLITFPVIEYVYCFDLKISLPDGSNKVMRWTSINPKSFVFTRGRKLYIGKVGYIGEYTGFLDDASTYRLYYYTPWLDFGNPIQISVLKRIAATFIGVGNQNIFFKWMFDYSDTARTVTKTINGIGDVSEYNVAEYGEGEYQGDTSSNIVLATVPARGHGKVIKIGIETEINQKSVSIQQIDIYTKEGRLEGAKA